MSDHEGLAEYRKEARPRLIVRVVPAASLMYGVTLNFRPVRRVKLMTDWAKYCDSNLVTMGDNVTAIGGAR
jgi:hypothetical protein